MRGLGQTIARLAKARALSSITRTPPTTLRVVSAAGPNPGRLTMMTYIPQAITSPRSLVVVLHGCTQSAEGYARSAGWIEAADRFGFALLCPEQTPNNNPNVCFNWFQPADIQRGSGEAASIAQMISQMIDTHALESDRVYITGLSAGGAMANALLAAYPELIRAGAVIAGVPYGEASNVQEAFAAMAHQRDASDQVLGDRVRRAAGGHVGPWPRISVWHGDNDTTVSPLAGEAIIRQWVNVHGARPASPPASTKSRHAVWQSGDGEIVVEHHVIPGMGHGTPVSTGERDPVGSPGPYLLDVGLSSTLEILRSWGLSTTPYAAVQPKDYWEPPSAPLETVGESLEPRRLKHRPGLPATDVGAIINNALRSAGLQVAAGGGEFLTAALLLCPQPIVN